MGEVRVETADGILTVTLADVTNRNALGAAVVNGLHDAVTEANADPSVRAVVVTNEGTTFCAGANLKEQSGVAKGERPKLGFDELLGEIQRSPTPIVGKVKGHVVGGGNGLVAALDIAIAQDDVKFGFTEVRLGVTPAIISVVCLPKMRRGEAMEAFLRGNRFSASRAAELGLISRAVPAGELDAAVEAWEDLHRHPVARGDHVAAARAAAMIAMYLMMDTGLMAPVRGWLRRAEELCSGDPEAPARALIALVRTYERFMCGDMTEARRQSALAIELGERAVLLLQLGEGRSQGVRSIADLALEEPPIERIVAEIYRRGLPGEG